MLTYDYQITYKTEKNACDTCSCVKSKQKSCWLMTSLKSATSAATSDDVYSSCDTRSSSGTGIFTGGTDEEWTGTKPALSAVRMTTP